MAVGAILRGPRRMAMVYIVVAMAGLWLLVPPAARSVNSLLLRTVTASHGVVEQTAPSRAVVIRDELLVRTPVSGRFTALASEESRVRAGDVLAVIDTGEREVFIRAPRPGIVRFHWDAWASPADVDRLLRYSPDDWHQGPGEAGHVRDGDTVRAGASVARLVRSDGARLYLELPEDILPESRRPVLLKLPSAADGTFYGQVAAVSEVAPSARLIELDRYVSVLDAVRTVDVDVIVARVEGVVVPTRAIVWRDGRTGVFVRRPPGTTFLNVEVVASVDGVSVVEGLTPGTPVVINPERAISLQKWR